MNHVYIPIYMALLLTNQILMKIAAFTLVLEAMESKKSSN